MSKPMTIKQIKDIEMRVAGSTSPLADDVFTLLAEVARLKKLAKPNRKPKTRNVIRHIDTVSKIVYYTERGGDWNPMENPNYGKVCPCKDCANGIDNRDAVRKAIDSYHESESYGKKIYSKNKVDGDGYPAYDDRRERY